MSNILIRFNANYADDFDVRGFWVTTKELWEKHKSDVQKWEALGDVVFPYEAYFGTNEALEYYNFEDYLRNFKITEISQQEADMLHKLFKPKYSKYTTFGTVILIEY